MAYVVLPAVKSPSRGHRETFTPVSMEAPSPIPPPPSPGWWHPFTTRRATLPLMAFTMTFGRWKNGSAPCGRMFPACLSRTCLQSPAPPPSLGSPAIALRSGSGHAPPLRSTASAAAIKVRDQKPCCLPRPWPSFPSAWCQIKTPRTS